MWSLIPAKNGLFNHLPIVDADPTSKGVFYEVPFLVDGIKDFSVVEAGYMAGDGGIAIDLGGV